MDILLSKIVKTRKTHNCWGCMRKFDKGEEMLLVTGVDGGFINSVHWCKVCQEFSDTLPNDEISEGLEYGDLLNYDEHPEKIKQRNSGMKICFL